MANLPQGTVTFLFTDIEGSTKLAHRLGSDYANLLQQHQRIVRGAIGKGVEISTAGDSFFVAFDSAVAAVQGAVAVQRAMAEHRWPADAAVRVRIGLHTGQARVSGGDYLGLDVHRAARIAAAGHGGQVLLSESTHALSSRELPGGVSTRDLGPHRLKDLAAPEHLFEAVISGLSTDFPPLVTLDDRRTNIPIQMTSFVGRVREMGDLRELAASHRLITVIGVGGTGKTRLALQVAGELSERHPDGVWLVELAAVTSADLVAQEVARTLAVQDEPGRSIEETLLDFVRLKGLLLILDNCEHVIGGVAALVTTLFRSAPSLAVLATSREGLGISGETVFQLPSMGVPRPAGHDSDEAGDDWLDAIASSEAVRLFVERASALDPSFRLNRDNAAAVADICRRLDGIPLAIELAAARVTLLSVHDIDARLGDRFRLLTGGSRTALPRQQTLQALIDWSWDLLEEADRQVLRRLSVFVGGATLDAATAVIGEGELETLEGIGRLVDRSLVIADRGSPARYRLLETIRQYGRDRLLAAGEVVEMRDAHLRFHLELAERADVKLRGAEMVTWLERLDEDAENFRSALEWAFETDPESALRLTLAMAIYWRTHSMLEGFEWMSQAVDLIGRMEQGPAESAALHARVLAAAATHGWMTGNAAVGFPWAERAVALATGADDVVARYEALGALATTMLFTGQSERVVELSSEALKLAEPVGDWFNIAFMEAGLGQWDAESGELANAEQRVLRAAEAAERAGNPSLQAFVALSQGRIAGFTGRVEDARHAFDRAIAGYSRTGDAHLELVARSDLAHALRMAGEMEEAESMYRNTLHSWLHAGNRGAIANQLESFAFIAVAQDEFARATRLLGAAEAIRESASAPMLPFEQHEYDRCVARVREVLPGSTYEIEWMAGRRLAIEDAVALALAPDQSDQADQSDRAGR